MSGIFDLAAENVGILTTLFVGGLVVYKLLTRTTTSATTRHHTVKKSDTIEEVVGNVNDLLDGEMKEVKLANDAGSILLIRENGLYKATGSKCTHMAAPLAKGALVNGRIRCQWHGACFSTSTGDIEEMPGMDSLQCFPVRVEGQNLIVTAARSALKENWKRSPSLCSRKAGDDRVFAIVGAGAAGGMCAETLRKEGYTGRIVMIGKEPHAPYDRTKLSKTMSLGVDKMLLRPSEYYAENGIEVRWNTEATHIDPATQTIRCSSGPDVKYTSCFVATGGAPRTLPIAGHDLRNVFCLRVPEEATQILAVVEGLDLVIVGSSFIGMETAAALFQKAKSIAVIGMEKVPFERVLGAEIGAALQRLHEEKGGIVFHMERTVKELKGSKGAISAVVLDNGVELPAGCVVMGAGVIPSTGMFKEGVTKERDQSIVANEFLCAAPNLYVGGDIARYNYHYSGASVRIEHFGMAMFHGKIAALNMVGKPTKCESIPFFWTQQYGKSLRYTGYAHKYDEVIVDGDLTALDFSAYFALEGRVLAVAAMNRDPLVSVVSELMHNGAMLSSRELLAEKKKDGRISLGKRVQ